MISTATHAIPMVTIRKDKKKNMDSGTYIIPLLIAAGLAFIPANIAKKKGHSFGLWWFYGWMLFIVAVIHVNFIEDYNAPKSAPVSRNISLDPPVKSTDPVEELKKYKDLLDSGIITEEEFNQKKTQILNRQL